MTEERKRVAAFVALLVAIGGAGACSSTSGAPASADAGPNDSGSPPAPSPDSSGGSSGDDTVADASGPSSHDATTGDEVFVIGDDGPATPVSDAGIFDDPGIPECTHGFVSDNKITGTVDGQSVNIDELSASNLLPNEYQALSSADGAVVYPLDLKWSPYIGEGQSAMLTGGWVLFPDGQPMANQFICATRGDFAIEPLADASAIGRLFRFRITGGKQGQKCTGSDVVVDLKGCFYRTTTSLP